MKDKEKSKKDAKSLKKTLKKNVKEVKTEKKKAIKDVKREKEKAIKAIKKAKDQGLKADKKAAAKEVNKEKADKKAPTANKERKNTAGLEKNIEKSSETTATTYNSVDLKADEAISRVIVLDTVQDIDSFVKKEKRTTILKAADKRKGELDKA